ncbi:MAG: hypothetical protein OEU76_09240 [Cyclobacteriaceae bacterium]|nr:hypothetical protein [Cyclobacteriaceae bacterium]
MMVNRYTGEIRINPIAILRNEDFNNSGEIKDIQTTTTETIQLLARMTEQLNALKAYLKKKSTSNYEFYFADGGYIGMKGFTDAELLELKAQGLIQLFDFSVDKDWVKKYGAQFGLIWEDGRAVEI